MGEYRYILEPYKGMNTRYSCPSCQQRGKTFTLYIDTETGKHIHPSVGRCNRETNCGHHYTPKQYFRDHNISLDTPYPKTFKPRPVAPIQNPISFIPVEVFKASLNPTAFETNNFVKFLIDLFGVEVASQVVSRYFIATSKHWNGATVFWQIDTQGKVRTGKIMLYSPITGKRVKEPFNHINWVHKALKQPTFELRQCLFGEHLLKFDKTRPVAIVESEKTAIIASIYLPQFIWVAVGSLTNLNAEKCNILKGRTVILFPDLNGFEKWNSKAKELSSRLIGTTFTVSDLLERKATEAERKQGFDLADYLIKFNYKDFVLPGPEATEPPPGNEEKAFEQPGAVCALRKPEQRKPESWEQDISNLENYFKEVVLPTKPIELNSHSTITNIPLFIESNIAMIKESGGNKNLLLPYLTRLRELANILEGGMPV